MHIALSLVGFTFLAVQCHSRASQEIDRQYPAETVLYQYIDRRNLKQENLLHRVPRAAEQLKYEGTNYPQDTRPQDSQAPLSHVAPRSAQEKKPIVEQFLKEVTPTTKTLYDPRNQKAESKLYQQWVQETHKQPPVAQNILAYQNALIARQNAIYEKQRADQLQKQVDALPQGVYLSHYTQNTEPNQKLGKFKSSSPNDELLYYTNLQYERDFKKHKDQLKAKQPVYKIVNLHKAVPEQRKVEKPKTPDVVYYSDVNFEHQYNNNQNEHTPKQPYIKIEHVQNHISVPKAGIPKTQSPELEEDYAKYEYGFNNRKGKLEKALPYEKPEAAKSKTPDVVYYSDVKFEHEFNHKNHDFDTKQPYVNIQTSVKQKVETPTSGTPDVVYYRDKFEHAYDDNQKHDYGSEPYNKRTGGKQKDAGSKLGNPEHDLVYYSDVEYEHEYNDHKDDYKPPSIKTKHSHKTSTLHKSENSKSASPEHDYYRDRYEHDFDKNKDDFEPNQRYKSTKTTPPKSTTIQKQQKIKDTSAPDVGLDHFTDAEYDYEYSKHRALIESDEPYVDTHYGDIEYEYNKQRDEIEADHPYIKSPHSEIDYEYNKQKDDIEAQQPYGKPQVNRKSGLEGKRRKSKPFHPAEDLAARYADFEYEYELTKKRAEFAEEPYSEPEYDDDKSGPVEIEEKTPSINNKAIYRTNLEYEHGGNEGEGQKPAIPKFQARIIQNSQPEIILVSKEGHSALNKPDHHSIPHLEVRAKQPKDKVFVSDVTYQKNAVYQPDQQKPDPEYYAEPQFIQYQIQPSGSIAYLSNQKGLTYQQPTVEQTQQIAIPKAESLQYKTNGQYHAGSSTKPRQRVQYVLVPGAAKPTQRYPNQQYSAAQQEQPQQSQPAYLGPTDEEYQQSELKQKLGRNSSLRVLKTGKPVVFIGHEE